MIEITIQEVAGDEEAVIVKRLPPDGKHWETRYAGPEIEANRKMLRRLIDRVLADAFPGSVG